MKPIKTFTVLAVLIFLVPKAYTSPLNIHTGLQLSLQHGDEGSLTLSFTNENSGAPITTFNSWSFGLQLIPQLGATGTATLISASLPLINPALTDPEDPPLFLSGQTLSVPANGTTEYTLVAAGNQSPVETTFALGETLNALVLNIGASPNASGIWNLYAVINASNLGAWFSSLGTPTNFGNLPAANGDFGTVLIGNVSVVPEPSVFTLVLLAVALLFLKRNRRVRASVY